MRSRPTLEELFNRAGESLQIRLQTCAFAEVVDFDPDGNTVTVDFVMRQPLRQEDSSETAFTALPRLAGVPVQYPGGNGVTIAWPLVAGDSVLVVFPKLDHGPWFDSGKISDAELASMHSLASPVALPLTGRSPAEVPASGLLALAPALVLAETLANAKAAAVAELVEERFALLLSAIENAAVTGGDGGATFKSTIVQALKGITPPGTPVTASVAAAKVKIE